MRWIDRHNCAVFFHVLPFEVSVIFWKLNTQILRPLLLAGAHSLEIKTSANIRSKEPLDPARKYIRI
jgi:hypothetical protein